MHDVPNDQNEHNGHDERAALATADAGLATAPQRRRGLAILVVMLVLAAGGAAARRRAEGPAPLPCARPALSDDGVLVCDGRGGPPGARAWLVGQKLDVNTATRGELAQLDGIGPALADAIVTTRDGLGGFHSMEQLDLVPGVGPKTLALLRERVGCAERP